jgi:hypothetical protein
MAKLKSRQTSGKVHAIKLLKKLLLARKNHHLKSNKKRQEALFLLLNILWEKV